MANMNPQVSTGIGADFRMPALETLESAPECADRDGLLFTTALRGAHNAPDIRAEKIEKIRAKIASGTYVIDAKRIAQALLREDPGLFKF